MAEVVATDWNGRRLGSRGTPGGWADPSWVAFQKRSLLEEIGQRPVYLFVNTSVGYREGVRDL